MIFYLIKFLYIKDVYLICIKNKQHCRTFVSLPEMAKDAFDGVSYLASELTLAPVKALHCVKSDQPVVLYLRVKIYIRI